MLGSVINSVLAWVERPSQRRNVVIGAVTLMPVAVLLYTVARYTIDAPFLDEWTLVPLVEKSYEGGLTFGDFWGQHNEHRLLFPKLLTLFLIRASDWRTSCLQGVTLLFAVGIILLVLIWLRGISRRQGVGFPYWAAPLLALLVFSMDQWENWFMGMQSLEYMNVLAVLGGFVVLARRSRGWPTLFWGALLGVVASYSRANGLGYWPIAGVLVWVTGEPGRRRKGELAVWCVVAAGVVASYLYSYHTPGGHASPISGLRAPGAVLAYVAIALGGPVANWHAWSAGVLGLCALAAVGSLTWVLVRREGIAIRGMSPILAGAAYAVFSASITAVGRAAFKGVDQGMSSRYLTNLNLVWYAVVCLSGLYVAMTWQRWSVRGRVVVMAVGIVFAGLLCANSAYGMSKWTERYRWRLPAVEELRTGNNADTLQRLFPGNPDIVLEYREVLKRRHLSVFRDN